VQDALPGGEVVPAGQAVQPVLREGENVWAAQAEQVALTVREA
jgi:hypothetical protein